MHKVSAFEYAFFKKIFKVNIIYSYSSTKIGPSWYPHNIAGENHTAATAGVHELRHCETGIRTCLLEEQHILHLE